MGMDPTTVVFWLIITWSLSFFFTEIAETNYSIEAYVLVLSKNFRWIICGILSCFTHLQ